MRVFREIIVPGRRPLPDGSWGYSSVPAEPISPNVSVQRVTGAAYDSEHNAWRVLVVEFLDDEEES